MLLFIIARLALLFPLTAPILLCHPFVITAFELWSKRVLHLNVLVVTISDMHLQEATLLTSYWSTCLLCDLPAEL